MKFFKLPALCLVSFTTFIQIPAATAGDDGILAIVAAGALLAGQMNEEGTGESSLTLIPSIALQNKNLSFDQQYSGAESNKADFDVNIPVISASLTASYSRFFATLKYEKDLDEASTGTDETLRSGGSNLIAIPNAEVNVGREDKNITIGYNTWKKLNIFVGYMEGETTLKPDPSCAIQTPPNAPTNCNITNRSFIHRYLGDSSDYKQEYTEEGPYVGLSYAWRIAEAGVLSASYAYAKMDGKYEDNLASDPTNFFGGTIAPFKYEGTTTGNSIGITWTAPLSETSGYFVDIRKQKYDMDGSDKTGNSLYTGTFLNTEEKINSITAGVQFYF